MKVGIEKLAVYPCGMKVGMRDLVSARGGNVSEVCEDMMIDARSVNPPWEDPVTTAVNACQDLLTAEDRDAIRLLLVGTETGPDQEKSISTWVQRYAGLRDDCLNLELKHACFAGTAALKLAAHWLLGQPPGVKALVVTTDQSRQHFHRPYEFVMGAAAVAMVISREPGFMELELGRSGIYTHEVSDLTRPTSRVEAGHSETSLLSYLDAVDITFERYLDSVGDAARVDTLDALRAWLPYQIYHAPFGGITARAHRAVCRTLDGFDAAACRADYSARVAPTLQHNRQMGGTYASSVFISLLGCVDAFGAEVVGQRVGIYSYGSGSTAEFYSGVFGAAAPEVAAANDLRARLAERFDGGVRCYEEAERERSAFIDVGDYRTSREGYGELYERRYAGQRKLVFTGISDWERQYEWS